MLTYKLSRREKVLVLVLAVILVVIAWFVLVYQSTTDEIARMDGEISSIESEIEVDTARLAQMNQMEDVVAQRKAEGARAVTMPEYDNMRPLMAQLNVIMSAAETYTLTFDDIDSSNEDFVARGVRIDYGAKSYAQAESLVQALADGDYPCCIDSVSITDATVHQSGRSVAQGTSPVSASVHVTFFEQLSAQSADVATEEGQPTGTSDEMSS